MDKNKHPTDDTEAQLLYKRLQNRTVGKAPRSVQFKLPGILHKLLEDKAELRGLSLNEAACMLLSGSLIEDHLEAVSAYLVENGLSDG